MNRHFDLGSSSKIDSGVRSHLTLGMYLRIGLQDAAFYITTGLVSINSRPGGGGGAWTRTSPLQEVKRGVGQGLPHK